MTRQQLDQIFTVEFYFILFPTFCPKGLFLYLSQFPLL